MTPADRQELQGVLGAAATRARGRGCPPGTTRVTTRCGAESRSYCEPVRGIGDAASDLRAMPLPGALERYLATGAPMSVWRRDLGAATAQIPRWVYGVGAALAVVFGARAYTRWRDAK